MNGMLRVGGLAMAAVVLAAPAAAYAQQEQQAIFGWAFDSGASVTYVSDSSMLVPSSDFIRSASKQRWSRALNREGVNVAGLSAYAVGTPGGVHYDSIADADDARFRFINAEKRRGSTVRVIQW